MERIKLVKKPRLRNPYLIVAWPGMGEVSFKAAYYLIEELGAEEFAYIPAEYFYYPVGIEVKDGILAVPELPQSRFYFWRNKSGKRDLIIFISNAQPDLTKAEKYAQRILEVAKTFKVKEVIGFASMPQAIDHTHEPAVWFTATSKELVEKLKSYNPQLLSAGQISGMNGLFLGIAKKEGLEGFCLLGEIPLYTIQIENPRATLAVLRIFCRIVGININLDRLMQQAQKMESEINKLLDYLKVGSGEQPAPISEDEIERIKKSLSQLTQLPGSIKDKIEKLFQEARENISRASELKAELDKWNVYKEYEDRFLDLFRKSKEKGN
ncbi:MAG: PAC2 family protein [Candidatus Omnitrophica bacterium]|nr:PAC2 family protein [Candidatus Omnitrophota bacterium]